MGVPIRDNKKFNKGGKVLKAIHNAIGRKLISVVYTSMPPDIVSYRLRNSTREGQTYKYMHIKVDTEVNEITITQNMDNPSEETIPLVNGTNHEVEDIVLRAVCPYFGLNQ